MMEETHATGTKFVIQIGSPYHLSFPLFENGMDQCSAQARSDGVRGYDSITTALVPLFEFYKRGTGCAFFPCLLYLLES